jgi:hypothetical protein
MYLQASSQQRTQVGHSVSVAPDGPRGCTAPHRQRIGSPTATWRSFR